MFFKHNVKHTELGFWPKAHAKHNASLNLRYELFSWNLINPLELYAFVNNAKYILFFN